ncbi:hypothetical protein ACUNWD_17420 [Sunxiuqinia sp. A32]|uniref:hypothetical protein n=1 Tax=Sunxiuqinia sp. A32 TaxID=3461496 RepID=UPI004045C3A5
MKYLFLKSFLFIIVSFSFCYFPYFNLFNFERFENVSTSFTSEITYANDCTSNSTLECAFVVKKQLHKEYLIERINPTPGYMQHLGSKVVHTVTRAVPFEFSLLANNLFHYYFRIDKADHQRIQFDKSFNSMNSLFDDSFRWQFCFIRNNNSELREVFEFSNFNRNESLIGSLEGKLVGMIGQSFRFGEQIC